MKVIYFGAGSFWLTEAVYQKVKGVTEVIPGYMGGTVANPSEEMVATGTTGHVEVAKVVYDETVVSTEDLLNVFFVLHDPATPNHAERGVGSQYRTAIFYTDEQESEAADDRNGTDVAIIARVIAGIQATMPERVTVSTAVMSATDFYAADELHYGYYQANSGDDYCTTVILPRIEKVQKQLPQYF